MIPADPAAGKFPGRKKPDRRTTNDVRPKPAGKRVFATDPLNGGRPRNFIHVGNQHPIIRPALSQAAGDAIALEPLHRPRVRHVRRIRHHDVDDPAVKLAESRPVFLEEKRFGFVGKSAGGFNQDEFVHDARKFVQAQLQQLEFVEKNETIVDHSMGGIRAA
jgi:hypothetical protein